MPQIDLSFLNTASPLWWLGLILALAVGTWAYYRLAAPLSPGQRNLLRAARILAFLGLLFLLLEPLLTVQGESPGRPRLAVLVDRSSSMRLPGADGLTRREQAAELLAQLEHELEGSFDLDVQGFAGGLEPRREKDQTYPWEPLGVTAMGESLEEVLVRQAESPVGGILLLTDGVHTSGKDPALVARNLPVPVFTITLGDTVSPPDLLIRQVRVPTIAFADERLAVRAVLENEGLGGRTVTLLIRERWAEGASSGRLGTVLAERTVRLPEPDGREIEAALDIVPSHVGLTLFEISAAIAPEKLQADSPGLGAAARAAATMGETITLNNTRLFAVEVREKKTRVLYIEHEPDWDFSFLKRALDADTTLSYTYLVRQADGTVIRYGSPGPGRMPRSQAELIPYAAVILGRTMPALLPRETVDALRQFLLEGGGVLFLGAGEGGDLERWQASWGDLLPLVVQGERRWGYTRSVTEVTLQGLSHEVTAVDENPIQSSERWKALPPIWIREGRYWAAPGAAVLLTARTAHPSREVPLLALAHAGAGRIGVLAGRGFWRWDFVMRSVSDDLPAARDFWKRMARWLAEPSQRERFHVSPTRPVFQDSEVLTFEAQLHDDAFQPVSGARIELTIERVAPLGEPALSDRPVPPDRRSEAGMRQSAAEGHAPSPPEGSAEASRTRIHLYPDGPAGRYAGTAAPLAPGLYRYRAQATGVAVGQQAQSREGLFWVEWMGPEFFDLASSGRLPALLAEASGGLAVERDEIASLVSAVPNKYKRVRVVRQAEVWNHWPVFAFLVGLLSLEWVLRRRKGLA
ncbi:MAG: hypothetical protein KAY24_12705 [Candidatus Eisenbacteria sp.]|nr:hypothetical protein [Candidatus Eisenbacteria bacterium]